MKRFFIITVLFFSYATASFAQQKHPVKAAHFFNKYSPNTYVKLRGEVNLTTYGAALSFPVLWVENRVKLVPLVGVFWKYFGGGEGVNPALGAKILFYFRKQYLQSPSANSFYAGIGGMSSTINYFDHNITERSRVNFILGYSRVLRRSCIWHRNFKLV